MVIGQLEANGQYYILTAAHNVRGVSKIKVVSGNVQVDARLVRADSRLDLAVLSVDKQYDMPATSIATTSPNAGAEVRSIGFPHTSL